MRSTLVLVVVVSALLMGPASLAQEHTGESKQAHTSLHEEDNDTVHITMLRDVFTKGRVEGHVRNHFMATQNYRSLSDHFANALGAEIGFKTASFHGFRVGFAGLFTYNLFSSNIGERDPISEKHPRLELELFDIEDPENKADLDRLDELYLQYTSKKLKVKAGRFCSSSPLMNPQDTRMKPYAFQGIELVLPLHKQGSISMAWFDHFSPRSTVSWFKAGETIGLFSPGVDEQGNPSGYRHHTSTRGVAVAGLQLKPHPKLHTEAWNYWIDNISNNSYGRAVAEVLPRLKVGVEGLYQFQQGQGGNPESSLAYFPDQRQWLAGGMLAYGRPARGQLSLNYLHIGDGGRFLFPREWGREQFFATLPRGRMEGTGRSDLLVMKAKKQWSPTFSSELALAKSWLPDPATYQYNKYGAVTYWGWVADLHYTPANPVLEGLSFRLLYVGRSSPGADIPLKDMYYNTNFHHLNFVSQFSF
jgi:hypothetical protein